MAQFCAAATGPPGRLAWCIIPPPLTRAAGAIRSELEAQGLPIGPYDVLIAGQALARGLVLVTANTREFARVEGLAIEDWSAPLT